ncbi:MAG TPA: hypothetical protein VI670_25825 [Thermoanaerobaculia bacterium]|jgi:hypothetical protein
MDPQYRALFNRQFTQERYAWMQSELSRRLECEFEFRLAETPLFLPADFRERIADAARAILAQLSDPARIAAMKRAIPPRWDTPGMDALPSFTQIDFAVVRDGDTYVPKLIELQGFPSLTAFQVVQRDVWRDAMRGMEGLDRPWSCWFSGLDRDAFLRVARRTIVGEHDPHEVILLDIEPRAQKTYPDFAATKLLFGVDAADPRELTRRGNQLFCRDGTRVRRIYNRVVFDELLKKNLEIPFDYRDDLDVEWAPHPNWYWVWSKFSLPFLDHPSVPRATFVSEVERVPDDFARNYVLKPLFSFAGGGVNVEPTAADLDAIPESERSSWCIQEKIEYAPALQAPDGGVKVEIRMMFLRPDDEARPLLCQNLVRLSRGKMLGVDFNKQFTWVGSSVAVH